jgi:hypothetical protein
MVSRTLIGMDSAFINRCGTKSDHSKAFHVFAFDQDDVRAEGIHYIMNGLQLVR